jgi:hypothetical protein
MQFSDHGACSLAPHDVAAYMTNIMQRQLAASGIMGSKDYNSFFQKVCHKFV